MGTNFYLIAPDGQQTHIGKRSAAGMWCWDCGVSLCIGADKNPQRIHEGRSTWAEACPKCGKTKADEPIESSSAGRELGWNKEKPMAKAGVKSCSSFSWAMDAKRGKSYVQRVTEHLTSQLQLQYRIEDEYRRVYSLEDFDAVLQECPIQFFHHIGIEFC